MPIHYEIRSQTEKMAEGAKDTLPKQGRVNEVCREWLVKEDGALAHRLQNEEIEHHYTGNKSRNAQVREDFPCARAEQMREEEEAAIAYARQVMAQEERDARVAQQLAERIEAEERERRRARLDEDQEVARKLQERERLRIEKSKRERLESANQNGFGIYNHDMNSVGLPSPHQFPPSSARPDQNAPSCSRLDDHPQISSRASEQYAQASPRLEQYNQASARTEAYTQSNKGPRPDLALSLAQQVRKLSLQDGGSKSPEHFILPAGNTQPVSEEEARRIQEEQDAELARRLQEEESGNNEAAMLDQDRLMAIEAQDKELARLLQERERAKAKRARERARQKALLKKQQEEESLLSGGAQPSDWPDRDPNIQQRPTRLHQGSAQTSDWPEQDQLADHPIRATRPTDLDLSGARNKPRYPDPEAIEVLDSSPEAGPSYGVTNIAMAIDPTYPRRANYATPDLQSSNISSPALSLPPPDFDEDIPPYMPIQGQRRTASLEKKAKKGKAKKEGKDGCKQQ